MVTRRAAKKARKVETLGIRALVGGAKPCPPPRTGVLLVPAGYVGWILITTPPGYRQRRKVRWVDAAGRVWRDDLGARGNGFHINRHARTCRVEPAIVLHHLVCSQDQQRGNDLVGAAFDETTGSQP